MCARRSVLSTANATQPAPLDPRLVEGLTDIFERQIAFNQVLGLRVLSLDSKAPKLQFDMRPELVGNYSRGMLHGGVISAALDVAGGMATMLSIIERHASHGESVEVQLGRFARVGTIDLRVDYLRPGLGSHFVTTSEVMRYGSRVAVVRSDLHNEGNTLIASAVAAYTVG